MYAIIDCDNCYVSCICTSRSFPGMVTDMDALRTSISNFARNNPYLCGRKQREQNRMNSSYADSRQRKTED